MDWNKEQQELCKKYNSPFVESPMIFKVGVSLNVRSEEYPINGLRHPLTEDTSGWYIWAGEYSDDPDFFVPLHISHLVEWRPEIIKYLGLSPGWRFLIAPNYEDVWEDDNLLDV